MSGCPQVHDFNEVFVRTDADGKKHSPLFCPEGAIPLWIADTDFKSPQPVIDALIGRAGAGLFGYTVPGTRMRAAAASWYARRFGWEFSPDCVTYSPGVMAGIVLVIRALTVPGDDIVTQTPCYTPFIAVPRDNGRNLLQNEMRLIDGRYELDFADLEEKLSRPRTRLLLLSNPQNPSGRVFTKEELERIGDLCLKHDVFVISDEIHCDFIYPGHKHVPFAGIRPEFSRNSITFINPSKTFNLAGLHTGAMITENGRVRSQIAGIMAASKLVSEHVFGSLAFAVAYEKCEYYVEQQIAHIAENRRMAEEFFRKTPGIKFIVPEGTYLFWLDCRELCRGRGMNQTELRKFFREKAKLELNDGLSFGSPGEGFMRLNAACTHKTMQQALERIAAAL